VKDLILKHRARRTTLALVGLLASHAGAAPNAPPEAGRRIVSPVADSGVEAGDPAAHATRVPRPSWGAYVEDDLGVLLLFGGVGVLGGASYGPVRAGLGFYRFDSPYRALSGAPDGFDLKVDAIVQADVAWHPFSKNVNGGYLEAVGQLKRQRVENLENGARVTLDSALLGPEIGWVFRVRRGLYLKPRIGALYYVASPQGSERHPVDVGGKSYDNPRHQAWDTYGTLGIGYIFD
jgi:hypothetical protein